MKKVLGIVSALGAAAAAFAADPKAVMWQVRLQPNLQPI